LNIEGFEHILASPIIFASGFAFINYLLMRNQTYFLESLYQQIYSMQDLACCTNNLAVEHLVNWLEENGIARMTASIFYTHLVMYVLLVLSISVDKPLPKKPLQQERETQTPE
jgi:hypothetical protein